ncbi:MAG: ThuA domain-containing protein [Anaerolineales bacterium]|jgi:type 1 glutamine amidotransferase
MKKVLLVTDGIFHPPFLARKALHETLAELDDFEFQHVRSMENLPHTLKDFSAMVIYLHHKKISEGALTTLDDFVFNGGGILGVHTATAAYKEQLHYFEILGGRFIGHGPVASFEVKPFPDSEIFTDIPSFSVKDELYIHDLQPGITAHFTAVHEGQEIPVVWTYHYGQGRVCYAVPGHRTETMRNETYQKILQRGLAWVCGD